MKFFPESKSLRESCILHAAGMGSVIPGTQVPRTWPNKEEARLSMEMSSFGQIGWAKEEKTGMAWSGVYLRNVSETYGVLCEQCA